MSNLLFGVIIRHCQARSETICAMAVPFRLAEVTLQVRNETERSCVAVV